MFIREKIIFSILVIILFSQLITSANNYLDHPMTNISDFEYKTNSREDTPDIETVKSFIMSNTGGVLVLKDNFNHTIDLIVYGEVNYSGTGWKGISIADSGKGIRLKI